MSFPKECRYLTSQRTFLFSRVVSFFKKAVRPFFSWRLFRARTKTDAVSWTLLKLTSFSIPTKEKHPRGAVLFFASSLVFFPFFDCRASLFFFYSCRIKRPPFAAFLRALWLLSFSSPPSWKGSTFSGASLTVSHRDRTLITSSLFKVVWNRPRFCWWRSCAAEALSLNHSLDCVLFLHSPMRRTPWPDAHVPCFFSFLFHRFMWSCPFLLPLASQNLTTLFKSIFASSLRFLWSTVCICFSHFKFKALSFFLFCLSRCSEATSIFCFPPRTIVRICSWFPLFFPFDGIFLLTLAFAFYPSRFSRYSATIAKLFPISDPLQEILLASYRCWLFRLLSFCISSLLGVNSFFLVSLFLVFFTLLLVRVS